MNELKNILDEHKKWLTGEGGSRADLSWADLSWADLSEADLRRADLSRADLSWADLSWADLSEADLRRADLRGANLSRANLRGADLDFSVLPLWCGSLAANFDDRQIIQILYHAVKAGLGSNNTSQDVKAELVKLVGLANQFHRVNECGRIEEAKNE